jgi:hypothetical protein
MGSSVSQAASILARIPCVQPAVTATNAAPPTVKHANRRIE